MTSFDATTTSARSPLNRDAKTDSINSLLSQSENAAKNINPGKPNVTDVPHQLMLSTIILDSAGKLRQAAAANEMAMCNRNLDEVQVAKDLAPLAEKLAHEVAELVRRSQQLKANESEVEDAFDNILMAKPESMGGIKALTRQINMELLKNDPLGEMTIEYLSFGAVDQINLRKNGRTVDSLGYIPGTKKS